MRHVMRTKSIIGVKNYLVVAVGGNVTKLKTVATVFALVAILLGPIHVVVAAILRVTDAAAELVGTIQSKMHVKAGVELKQVNVSLKIVIKN